MRIVDVSNVDVKVGIVGSGVGGRGVLVRSFARSPGVLVGNGEELALGMVFVAVTKTKVAEISP